MNEHQPFLFNNVMFYCKYSDKITLKFGNEYQVEPWKIWVKTESNDIVVNTIKEHDKLGSVKIECNPHIITLNNKLKFAYNGGFCKTSESPIVYYYIIAEIDLTYSILKNYTIVRDYCFSGALINNDFFYVKKTPERDFICRGENVLDVKLPIQNIYRICPIFELKDMFIITIDSADSQFSSWIISVNGDVIKRITNNSGDNVYKCSINNNLLAYSVKNKEKRHIVTESYLN